MHSLIMPTEIKNYQRVIDATVKKLKIPFAVSGNDLRDLERFQTHWAAELDVHLRKMGECCSHADAPTPAVTAESMFLRAMGITRTMMMTYERAI